MREPHQVTVVSGERAELGDAPVDEVVGPLSHGEMASVYERTDVLLKLSRVEGMFGPPLEAFHRGATCLVTPVTGHEEYVIHGWNGLLADWDDVRGTARQLDLLARDAHLLRFLRDERAGERACVAILGAVAQLWRTRYWRSAASRRRSARPPRAHLLADLRAGIELNGKLSARAHRVLRAPRAPRTSLAQPSRSPAASASPQPLAQAHRATLAPALPASARLARMRFPSVRGRFRAPARPAGRRTVVRRPGRARPQRPRAARPHARLHRRPVASRRRNS